MASKHSSFTVQNRFSAGLREALRAKYGSIPSAAFIAIQFNRRLNWKNGVSQETVRRWLRGLSMPSYCHLDVLTIWLKLDLGQLLGSSAIVERQNYPEKIMRVAEIIAGMPPITQDPLLNLISCFSSSGEKFGGRSH